MGYRLIRLGEAWGRLLWSSDQVHKRPTAVRLQELAAVPGVRLESSYLDLPCTVYGMTKVQELCAWLGFDALEIDTPTVPLWTPARPSLVHQTEGATRILLVPGILVADSMGTGKSQTAIVAAESIRRTKPDHPVVVLGPLSSRSVWEKELRALGAPKLCALSTRDIHAEGVWDKHALWYFVHYDIALDWMTMLQERRPCVAILDESHYIKNGRIKRAKGAGAIANLSSRRILLSGTPIENDPGDLWNQLQLLTGFQTWGSPVAFRQRYAGATFDGYGYKDSEPTRMEELQERLAPFYLRRTVKDVGQHLPPLTRELRSQALPKSLQHEHDQVLKRQSIEELVEAIVQGTVKDQVLELLTRLRQITAHGKIPMTLEAIEDAQTQGESVVVFCWERSVAEKISEKFPGSFLVTGDHDHEARARTVELFQASANAVLVATYGSLREAVTLHRARIIILHDWTWLVTQMLQAEARVYRTGQKRACKAIWMCAEGSMDTLLARALYKKALAMQSVGNELGLEALVELGIDKLNPDGDEHVQARVAKMLERW